MCISSVTGVRVDSRPFIIAPAGHNFYINDNSTVDDSLTTANGTISNGTVIDDPANPGHFLVMGTRRCRLRTWCFNTPITPSLDQSVDSTSSIETKRRPLILRAKLLRKPTALITASTSAGVK